MTTFILSKYHLNFSFANNPNFFSKLLSEFLIQKYQKKIFTIEKFINHSYKTNLFEAKYLKEELNNILKLLILYNSLHVYIADRKLEVLNEIKTLLTNIGEKIFSKKTYLLFKKVM